MPIFNYYLQTEHPEEINKVSLIQVTKELAEQVDDDGAYLCDIPALRTRKQLKALRLILCNILRYQKQPIWYSRRHEKTQKFWYNPQQIGSRVISDVVDELDATGYVEKTRIGDNKFKYSADNSPAKLSEFKSTESGLELAYRLQLHEDEIYMDSPTYVKIRKTILDGGDTLDFPEDWLSMHFNQRMKEYCSFLNEHDIYCHGTNEQYKDIHIVRSFRDWDYSGKCIYGGRGGGYWMQTSKEHRPSITIDNHPTIEIDFNSSVLNVLNFWKTGSLFPEDYDGYEIDGVPRELIKALVTRCMLNTDSRQSSSARMKAMCEGELSGLAQVSELTISQMTDAVEEKHSNLAEYFYRGEAMNQHYQWLESSLVFEIAHNAGWNFGVPCLTVHDSFRFKESDLDTMKQIINETTFNEIVTKQCLL